MATIAPVALGAAANDSSGDTIRAGGQKLNDNDTAINAELVALLTAIGIASGATDMGTFTGNTITDNQPLNVGLQDLENALTTLGVLSATYAPNNTGVPVAADSLETGIAKLDYALRNLNEADRMAGTFDASAGVFPTVANGGVVNGQTVEAGFRFEASVAGTIDGRNFLVGDTITALQDAPSTTTVAGFWFHELNRPPAAYSPTVAAQMLVFDGTYIQGDHLTTLPKITTENDGQAIHVAATAPWGDPALANQGWTPAGGDTIEALALPAGSVDVVTLIPVFADLQWKIRTGGAPAPDQSNTYDTVAELPDPTTIASGTQASVVNDPGLNGVYLATGPAGGQATTWIQS